MAPQPKTWLRRARQMKSKVTNPDPTLLEPWWDEELGACICTNKSRLHIYYDTIDKIDPAKDPPAVKQLLDAPIEFSGVVSKAHLIGVAKLAKAFQHKDWPIVPLHFDFYEKHIDISCTGDDGKSSVTMVDGALWLGYDGGVTALCDQLVTLLLDPNFLLAALDGMAPKSFDVTFTGSIVAHPRFIKFIALPYVALLAPMADV